MRQVRDLMDSPFVGVHALRGSLTELLATIREQGQDLVVTQNGKPVAVLVEVERYLEMQEAIREFSDPEYLASLLQRKRLRLARAFRWNWKAHRCHTK